MSFPHQEAVVVNALSALSAGHALSLVSGNFPAAPECHLHPLLIEEVFVPHLAIRGHLLQVLVFYFRVQLSGQRLGRFARGDADCAMGIEVHEGRGHLAPIPKLERPFTQAATGDDADGIGSASIDFDEGDQALPIPSPRLLNSQARASQHGQPHPQHLPCAQMSMGDPGFFEQFLKTGHSRMDSPAKRPRDQTAVPLWPRWTGAPCLAPAYMGRKRVFPQMLSLPVLPKNSPQQHRSSQ